MLKNGFLGRRDEPQTPAGDARPPDAPVLCATVMRPCRQWRSAPHAHSGGISRPPGRAKEQRPGEQWRPRVTPRPADTRQQ